MTIKSYKMGPGSLQLGAGGTLLAVAPQVRAFTVKAAERLTRTDPVPVLSGEELAAEEDVDYDWTVTGTFIQDIEANGVLDWSWTNKGTPQAFTFIPNTAKARKVTGTLVPIPLDVGGDVDLTKRPEVSFTWRLTADPVMGAV
jgi:hypothetical protein